MLKRLQESFLKGDVVQEVPLDLFMPFGRQSGRPAERFILLNPGGAGEFDGGVLKEFS